MVGAADARGFFQRRMDLVKCADHRARADGGVFERIGRGHEKQRAVDRNSKAREPGGNENQHDRDAPCPAIAKGSPRVSISQAAQRARRRTAANGEAGNHRSRCRVATATGEKNRIE